MVLLGEVVQANPVEEGSGDAFGAVEDGGDCGLADQRGQAEDGGHVRPVRFADIGGVGEKGQTGAGAVTEPGGSQHGAIQGGPGQQVLIGLVHGPEICLDEWVFRVTTGGVGPYGGDHDLRAVP